MLPDKIEIFFKNIFYSSEWGLKESLLPLLLPFLFLMAAFGKGFAYFSIDLEVVRLYISEIVFITLVIWISVKRRAVLKELFSPHGALLLSYLLIASCQLLMTLFSKDLEFNLMGIFQNFGVGYLAIWGFIALALTEKEWMASFKAILYGIAFGQSFNWVLFVAQGIFPNEVDFQFEPLVVIDNAAVNPLIPVAFLILSSEKAFVLNSMMGLKFLNFFLRYFKRSWFLVYLGIAVPILLLVSSRKKRDFRYLALSVLMGCVVAAPIYFYVSKRFNPRVTHVPVFDYKIPIEPTVIGDLKGTFFHGDDNHEETTSNWRWNLQTQVLDGFKKKPIFGHGFDGPVTRYVKEGSNQLAKAYSGKWIAGPHNSFLTVLYRLGIVGLLPILVLMSLLVKKWWQARKLDRFCDLIFGSFLAQLVFCFFNVGLENPQGAIWFWFFLVGAIHYSSLIHSKKFNPILEVR